MVRKFLEWGPGSLTDENLDGNVEFKQTGIKVLGRFELPDIKATLPTAMAAKALQGLGEAAGAPVIAMVGWILGKK